MVQQDNSNIYVAIRLISERPLLFRPLTIEHQKIHILDKTCILAYFPRYSSLLSGRAENQDARRAPKTIVAVTGDRT